MSNPFKVGDKVVRLPQYAHTSYFPNPATVYTVEDVGIDAIKISPAAYDDDGWWGAARFRAAIAGQDYDVPTKRIDTYQGHLPDGSSVQAHSAGGLYPVVLVYRDKLGGSNADGKYDVGVISPKNQDPIWFKSSDAAISVADAIKANL